jgi:[ribosomal protein S5]-alanine N-acetyltransferase
MDTIETERLLLRKLTADDAAFALELLNEPAYIKNIADRGVRTEADAVEYITKGPLASYEKFGLGLNAVVLKETGETIGMCGLLRRDYWDETDIGYAFLERFWSKGYAYEAASAMMDYGRKAMGLKRIVAITSADNHASMRVLEKLGLRFEKMITLPGYEDEETPFFVSAE